MKGQIAVVTGGGRGIGRAISEKLAAQGITVIVNYSRSSGDAEAAVQGIRNAGGQAEAAQFDVGSADSVDSAFDAILAKHGRVDILVNNAGIASDALLVRTKASDWQRTIDVNLSGAFYCARAVAKSMMKSKHGRIVNISSVIGEMGNAGQVAYASSKAGIFGLTKSLAKELASRNITVNAIAPGYIVTDMTSAISDERKEAMLTHIPLGRLGTPEEIADAVLFLCSPAASYITGETLSVNGGMHM